MKVSELKKWPKVYEALNKLAVQGLITGDTISKFDELLKEI